MRVVSILIGALVLVGVLHTRRAEACGEGGGGPSVGGLLVVGGLYAGATIGFAVHDVRHSDHSVTYGVGETLFNAPLAAAWTAGAIADARDLYSDHQGAKTMAVFAGIHTLLAVHGVYTIVKASRRKNEPAPRRYDGPPGMMNVGPVKAVVSPAPIANGGGIGLSGTF